MSAVQNAIERVIEYHEENCNGGFNSPCNLSIDARSELVQLRSDLQAAQERIAEQARQLDEVREIITSCASLDRYVSDGGIEDARVWLAANPAPQVDDQAAIDRFNDLRREREEDFSRRIEAAS